MLCHESGGKRTNGQPCQRPVAPGFTRCAYHGGHNPIQKIKAELALASVRMPSIEALHLIIDQFCSDVCPTCHFPKGDTDEKRAVIQAAKAILDRTGMGPSSKLELTTQSDGAVNLDLLTPEEKGAMLAAVAVVKELKNKLRQRQQGDAQPAEVVH